MGFSWWVLVATTIVGLSDIGGCQVEERGRSSGGSWQRPRYSGTRPEGILKLGRYPVKRESVTVSGFSSGGTLAQHLMFSHADLFSGIGVFSHAYYRCGPGNGDINKYDDACTKLNPGPGKKLWDPKDSLADIEKYARKGQISDPRELANKKLYVYAGLENVFFSLDTSLAILKIFEPFIKNKDNIRTRVQDANLVLPVDRGGAVKNCAENPLERNNTLFTADCGLNGPLEALQFMLGDANVRKGAGNLRLRPLRKFDQKEFFSHSGMDFMDDVGYIYVPTGCEMAGGGLGGRQSCYLHVYLHGCLTGSRFVGDAHIRGSGFLEIGEQNKIIMLFPQNINGTMDVIGCWDTYGATGPLYATREGNQVRVIKGMVSRILGDSGISFLEKRHARGGVERVGNGYTWDRNGIDPRR